MRRFSLRTILLFVVLAAMAVTWWHVGTVAPVNRRARLAEERAADAEKELDFLWRVQAVSRTLVSPLAAKSWPTTIDPTMLREVGHQMMETMHTNQIMQKKSPEWKRNGDDWLRQIQLDNGTQVIVVAVNPMMSSSGTNSTALLFEITDGFDVRHDLPQLRLVLAKADGWFKIVDEDGDGILDLVRDVPHGGFANGGFKGTYQITKTNFVLKRSVPRPFVRHIEPVVDGVVLQVQGKLCEISLGSDDGVTPGDVLDVFRQESPTGRIVIVRTEPNKAVAKRVADLETTRIQKGDRISTSLGKPQRRPPSVPAPSPP